MIQNLLQPDATSRTPAPGPQPDSYQSFDEVTYIKTANSDLLNAREFVIVQSAFISDRGVDRFLPSFEKLVKRGVRVCAFIQQPEHWLRRRHPDLPPDIASKLKYYENVIGRLEKAGLHVNVRQKIHEKFIVIDDDVVWEGTLNFLSHRDTFERPIRWQSRAQVANVIAKHRLDTCKQCWRTSSGHQAFTSGQAKAGAKAIAQALVQRRKSLRVSQRMLATSVGFHQSVISRYEDQTRDVLSGSLVQMAGGLGLVLIPVPWMLRHAVESLIAERLKHLDET